MADCVDLIPFESYRDLAGVSEKTIWRQIRSGSMYAACYDGRIYVSTQYHQPSLLALPCAIDSSPEDTSGIDGLTKRIQHLERLHIKQMRNLHLTKETIERSLSNTENLVRTKDDLIEMKAHEIESFSGKLSETNIQLIRIRQENEDLRMLARTLLQKPACK